MCDLVAVTETWLDSTICDGEIFPSSYQVIRKDRSRNGGGILLACNDHLNVKRCFEYETECKVLWCEVVIPNPLARILVHGSLLPTTVNRFELYARIGKIFIFDRR